MTVFGDKAFKNQLIDVVWLCSPGPGLSHNLPGGSDGKASAYNAGDLGSIPGLGRSPGEGNGTPLQYSCLENPMDRGAWWATVHGVAKNQTRLSNFTFTSGFPDGSDGKVSVYSAGDLGSIPGLGRFPGEGNGNPLQYSCLGNPMDGGAWCRLLSMGSQRVGHD